MAHVISADLLFARLRALAPDARSLLVAPVRSRLDVSWIVDDLAQYAASTGGTVTVADLTAEQAAKRAGGSPHRLSLGGLSGVDEARERLAGSPGYILVHGQGILDSPDTLLAAGAVDGVVIVARTGRTDRADLLRVRLEVERAGGSIVAALLL